MTSQKRVETFFKLVQHNDVGGVKEFLTRCDDLEGVGDVNLLIRTKSGDSALHVAATAGHLEMLRFLIDDLGGNVELANRDGKTPLHNAAQFSQLEIAQQLLQRGASVQAVKKADWTPLMLACTKDCLEIVQLLLDHSSDPTFRNKDGWNSVHIAAREGHVAIVEALLTHSTRLSLAVARSKNGRTPIHTAVTELLLRHGGEAVIDLRDSCDTTPLMDACRFGHSDILRFLKSHGADVSLENHLGMNCLHVAAEAGQSGVIRELVVEYGMEVNKVTRSLGLTPLHFACRENHRNAAQVLLELGACANIIDHRGHSCIQLAKTLKKYGVLTLFEKEAQVA